MKPVLFYLAIVYLITVSCPDVRKDSVSGSVGNNIASEPPAEKIIKSDCEEKIKAIPPVAERFTGEPAIAILEKSPRVFDPETQTYPSNYRTKIKEAMLAGVNFAGKYVVAEWGLGTGYQGHAIINAETGRIISYGLKSNEGVEFSPLGQVLIVNPKRNFVALPDRKEAQGYAGRFKRDYYKVERDSLVLICSEPANVGW
jgi:hypothetical protein